MASTPRQFFPEPGTLEDIAIPAWLKPATPPKPPLLIGLTGRAGSGKSTVAAMLGEFAFSELAFADGIAEMNAALFGLVGIGSAWMTERNLKESPSAIGASYRQLAQAFGDAGRQIHPDFWVNLLALRLKAAQAHGENVVISDVRYPNEAAFIQRHGGCIVRVLRNDLPAVRPHSSESHTDTLPITTELLNFGSKATLADQVERLVVTLRS